MASITRLAAGSDPGYTPQLRDHYRMIAPWQNGEVAAHTLLRGQLVMGTGNFSVFGPKLPCDKRDL
jgi:hypothetical protein